MTSLKVMSVLFCALLLACTKNTNTSPISQDFRTTSENAARSFIETLGPQQSYAMLGWQVGPDYKPMQHCFDHWYDQGEIVINNQQIKDCDLHAQDLSRLYASYSVEVDPIVFKSKYYWTRKTEFDQAWPKLVEAWKASGGTKDDASYLNHPGCVIPLQTGWTGSDYFYSGDENPICRAHKVEAIEGAE